MAFKRALVVDDSKSARISLQRMLEDQHLEVFLADCGEAAIDLLRSDLVDVIFMDHNMPGMDGLEALTTIKSDPRTATIPVMMYTTKEGEVYVSQARALGALGVLPKTFQPHVLFDMLLELGLVVDRRSGAEPPPATPAETLRKADGPDPERASDQQALGISVQTLMKRILEDQHLTLRADILQSHSDFARQVAAEILDAQHPQTDDVLADRDPAPPQARSGWASLASIFLAAALIVLASLYWQSRESQQQLNASLIRSDTQLRMLEEALQQVALTQRPAETMRNTERELETLTWAANRNAQIAFDQPAFNIALAGQLEALIEHLSIIGFRGRVVVESHLGEFCLISSETGYEPAPPESSIFGCALVGHPLDDSSFPEQRQDESFRAFVSNLAASGPDGIELQLIAHDRLNSTPLVEPLRTTNSAGEWNQTARQNHRLKISLVPDA